MYQILVFFHFTHSVQKIPILLLTDSKITTPTELKTTSFWPLIFFFFNFLKKIKIEEKKEDENRGWLQPPLWPKWGGFMPKGGGLATLKMPKKKWILGFWGWQDHPIPAIGVGRSHPQNPFYPIFSFSFFGFLGVAEPPPSAWGWFNHPQTDRGGG